MGNCSYNMGTRQIKRIKLFDDIEVPRLGIGHDLKGDRDIELGKRILVGAYKRGYNYWDTAEEEIAAWKIVTRWINFPMPKLAQNGLYDLQYLWRVHGIPVRNFLEDTMLLHHSIYIELKKDLGFMGSVYTDEASWKLMRQRSSDVVEKKDE